MTLHIARWSHDFGSACKVTRSLGWGSCQIRTAGFVGATGWRIGKAMGAVKRRLLRKKLIRRAATAPRGRLAKRQRGWR